MSVLPTLARYGLETGEKFHNHRGRKNALIKLHVGEPDEKELIRHLN